MKIIHKNKKAYFDYEVIEEYTAGLVLTGSEIKSIRLGNINLKGAYVVLKKNEAFLKGAHVSRYSYDSNKDYDAFRDRKLLLKRGQLDKIANHLNTQGLTLVPLVIGLVGRNAKVIIAVARGKKKYDKRHSIKEKDIKRRLDRVVRKY